MLLSFLVLDFPLGFFIQFPFHWWNFLFAHLCLLFVDSLTFLSYLFILEALWLFQHLNYIWVWFFWLFFFFFFLSGGSNFSVSLHVSVFYWMLYNLCEINIEAEVNNICAKRRIYLFCHAARVCTGVSIFSVDLDLDHIVDLVRFSTAQSSNDLRAGSIHSFSLGFGNGCLKDFYQVSCIAFIF